MIYEGLQLMVIGILTVYVFLYLLYLCISFLSLVLKKHSQMELQAMTKTSKKTRKKDRKENIVPIIMGAIVAYEKDIAKTPK